MKKYLLSFILLLAMTGMALAAGRHPGHRHPHHPHHPHHHAHR